jgi:hypothetical protein
LGKPFAEVGRKTLDALSPTLSVIWVQSGNRQAGKAAGM